MTNIIDTLKLNYVSMSSDEYHSDRRSLGSSTLKKLDSDGPEYAKAYHDGLIGINSSALKIGSAVHAIADGTFDTLFTVAPSERGYGTRDADKFQAMLAECIDAGLTLLTQAEYRTSRQCGERLRQFMVGKFHGHKTLTEPSIFWTHEDDDGRLVDCKCRPDKLVDDGLGGAWYLELKTAASVGTQAMRAAWWRYGYWIQQAHYEAGLIACGASTVRTRFICVRTAEPYDLRVFIPSDEDRHAAHYRWRQLVSQWAQRVATNDWSDCDMQNPTVLNLGMKLPDTLEELELMP